MARKRARSHQVRSPSGNIFMRGNPMEDKPLTEESMVDALEEVHHEQVRGVMKQEEPATPPTNRPLPLSLADIRQEALRQHANVSHTIADLEAWAEEIAATIRFLKERR